MIDNSISPSLDEPLLDDVPTDTSSESESPKEVTFRRELALWFDIVWPVALTMLCRTGMTLTDISIIGRFDSTKLEPAALAGVWCSLSYVIIDNGMINAVNALCSQAWGAKKFALVGTWYHIGLVCSLLATIPIGLLWVFAGDIFQNLVTMDETVKDDMNSICRRFAVGLPFMTAYGAMSRWLQSQNIVFPQLIVNMVCVMINVGLNLVLVHGVLGWEGLGFVGSPWATVISRALLMLGTYTYIYKYKQIHLKTCPPETYQIANLFNRQRMMEYAKLALPMAVSGILEEWQLQVVAIFTAHLGSNEIATHNALFQCFWFMSSFMWAVTIATSVRIGNHLGHGNIPGAKMVLRLASMIATAASIVVASVMILGRFEIGKIFSTDPEIWKLTSEISTMVGIGYSALSIFYVAFATLEAQGRAKYIAIAFFVGAWGVGVPCAYVFAFPVGWRLVGIWAGLSVGYGVVTLITLYFVTKSDWEQIVLNVRNTNRDEVEHADADAEHVNPSLTHLNPGTALDPLGV